MKQVKKQLWLRILSLLLAVCMLPVYAAAETDSTTAQAAGGTTAQALASGTAGENITWSLDDAGTLTLSGTGTVPSGLRYEGELGDHSDSIRAVVIGDDITGIEEYAFVDFSGLETVTVGNGVEFIGDYAFIACQNLESVSLGNSLTSIGEAAFNDTGLTSVAIPDSVTTIGVYAFCYCPQLESVTLGSGLITIYDGAFCSNESLKEITLPASVEYIGNEAFSDCPKLQAIWVAADNLNYSADASGVLFNKEKTQLLQAPGGFTGAYTVPAGVTDIGYSAFSGCAGLTGITIGADVASIGGYAFYGCEGLTEVTIPQGVTFIGSNSFGYCANLQAIRVAADNMDYSADANGVLLDKEQMILLQAPGGLAGAYTVPAGVEIIDLNAFYGCEGLTEITIPQGVTDIGAQAFFFCTGLTSIVLPEGLEEIAEATFGVCSSLTTVTIPSTVTSIGSSAFVECGSLTDLYFQGSPEQFAQLSLGSTNGAFSEVTIHIGDATVTGISIATLPDKMDYQEGEMLDATGLTLQVNLSDGSSFVVSEGFPLPEAWLHAGINAVTVSYWDFTATFEVTTQAQLQGGGGCGEAASWEYWTDGRLIISGTGTMDDFGSYETPWCEYMYDIRTVEIGEGITAIGSNAFCGHDSLTSVTLPESLTTIGEYAFAYCESLESISLGDNVAAIGEYAFCDCGSLESLSLGAKVASIGEGAFSRCDSLISLEVAADNANYSADASSVLFNKEKTQLLLVPTGLSGAYEIPATVTVMDPAAFSGCQALTQITVPAGITDLGVEPFLGCAALEAIWVAADNSAYSSDASGVLFNKAQTVLLRAPAALSGVYAPPQGLLTVADTAFSGCEGLTGVVLPDSTQELGWMCFANCSGLASVNLGSGMQYISGSAFYGCAALESIQIPAAVWQLDSYAFEGCVKLQAIWVDPENSNYCNDASGVLFNKSMTELVCMPAAFAGEYVIPETVETVWYNAFAGCEGLTAVTVPQGVVEIDSNTFHGCAGLAAINLPSTIEQIDYNAFYGCEALADVYFDGNEARWNQVKVAEGNEALASANIHFTTRVELTGISLESLPEKTLYQLGESLDTAGLALRLTYSDGTVQVVESGFAVTGFHANTVGSQTLTVTYEGFTVQFSVTVEAAIVASGTCGDGLSWTLDALGLLTVSGTGAMYDYDYYSSPWNPYFEEITSIVVESGVTTVGDYAFSDCWNVADISLPEGLTAIGEEAFSDCCNQLESITIPTTVTSIGSSAFSSCTALKRIRLPQGITTVPWSCFLWCASLESVELPDTVTAIESDAFNGCSALKQITLPQGVTTISWDAFYCAGLESIELPDSVVSVDKRAFQGCSELAYITIGKGLSSIGDEAFDCPNLVGFTVSPENAYFSSDSDGVLFNKDKTVLLRAPVKMTGAYTVPAGVEELAPNSFAYTQLTAVILPDSVTTIGSEAFLYGALQAVTMGKGVTAIDYRAFAWCDDLQSVTLSDSLTYIGERAFQDCSALESIVIPNSVTYLYAGIFANCSSLKKVTLSKNLTAIPAELFWGCERLTSVTIPSSVTDIGGTAFNGCKALKSITIPGSVTSIGSYAFQECHSLTAITIPASVVSIGNRAFGECYALARVTVGRGVTTIGDYAFANCSALRTVDFLGDPPTIGSNAFYGVSASAYSSASNSMWTESATQDYGGALSWGTKAMVQIISQPKTQTAYTDTQVSFSVAAAGDIAGYRWQYSKDGGKSWYSSSSATQGYNTATLTVNVTLARNGFKYRCRITDTNGGYHYSSAATLNAKQAYVFIDTQPVSRTVTEGDTVVFRVVASGQVAAYRWQYTTNGGASWNNSSSATQGYNTPTLSVNATLARNGFMYRCRITDHDGNYYYSDPATLTVKKLSLTFTQQPASTTVKQGSKACFTVAVEETGVTYRWQYSTNGTYWTNSTVYTEGYDQPTLYVTGAAKRDGFLYRCRITDSNGNRFYSDVAALWVNVPQQSAFATQPKDQYVMAGGKAVFSVTTVGEIASIQWQYQVKEGDAWYNSTANTQGYNTDTLTVSATNARNNFGYRCVITDADGYVHTSQEVRLHITKAQIDIQPQDQTVALGENAVFCAGTSGQTQKVYWQYSKDGGKSWYNSSSSFPGYDSLAMTVAATQARNGFMYRCVVIDADGNRINSEPAKLTVKEPYPAVGVAYKLGLFQNNIGQDFFFTGSTESASVNYRLELGGWGYAVDVYLEEAEDGYRLYFWNGGVKTYIRVFHYKDGNVGYGKGSLELTTSVPAEVYRYDAQANTLIYDHSSGNSYYMGTYSQYETVSVSNVYYITGSNAANVDKTQFPVRLYPQDHLD